MCQSKAQGGRRCNSSLIASGASAAENLLRDRPQTSAGYKSRLSAIVRGLTASGALSNRIDELQAEAEHTNSEERRARLAADIDRLEQQWDELEDLIDRNLPDAPAPSTIPLPHQVEDRGLRRVTWHDKARLDAEYAEIGGLRALTKKITQLEYEQSLAGVHPRDRDGYTSSLYVGDKRVTLTRRDGGWVVGKVETYR